MEVVTDSGEVDIITNTWYFAKEGARKRAVGNPSDTRPPSLPELSDPPPPLEPPQTRPPAADPNLMFHPGEEEEADQPDMIKNALFISVLTAYTSYKQLTDPSFNPRAAYPQLFASALSGELNRLYRNIAYASNDADLELDPSFEHVYSLIVTSWPSFLSQTIEYLWEDWWEFFGSEEAPARPLPVNTPYVSWAYNTAATSLYAPTSMLSSTQMVLTHPLRQKLFLVDPATLDITKQIRIKGPALLGARALLGSTSRFITYQAGVREHPFMGYIYNRNYDDRITYFDEAGNIFGSWAMPPALGAGYYLHSDKVYGIASIGYFTGSEIHRFFTVINLTDRRVEGTIDVNESQIIRDTYGHTQADTRLSVFMSPFYVGRGELLLVVSVSSCKNLEQHFNRAFHLIPGGETDHPYIEADGFTLRREFPMPHWHYSVIPVTWFPVRPPTGSSYRMVILNGYATDMPSEIPG